MFLYLAKAPYRSKEGGELFKIGITNSISSRMKSLSDSGVCGDYELLLFRQVKEARECEKNVFETLHHFRYAKNKEIFSFESKDEAIVAVNEAVLYYTNNFEISTHIRLPEYVLNQLEDRWYDEEFIV